ncbi:D-2-hydroxyacid dehydrogenase [Cohnella fermenti]|uniref:D-2-hydroxyacid dehydrogenase n=1 Tax=Cohnella fermenti TaxID=2565925 RepID=A0A4V3WE55_9BACL|nr:D-2-hydroxyacid dehydrogenase [Cohnella fermenti]THF74929.1 D-2-hydroxyacid dehydrogenase [Cohnella fermenti]
MRRIISMFGFTEEQERSIRDAAPGWDVVFGKPQEIAPETFRDAEIVCGWHPVVAEHGGLEAGAKLKWVQAGSAGVDNLPLDRLEERGVAVTTASGVHPTQMAETAFAMLLAFTRSVHHAIRNQVAGKWDRSANYTELGGKTMAVIGAGQIGSEIARLAQAFGMSTIGVRRSGKEAPSFNRVVTLDKLDEVLGESDVVVNILPGTDETFRLFDSRVFELMKNDALFLNLGRGPSVDTDALTAALQKGTIGGAGLDVFDPEPLPAGHPLWSLDNVIITPHIGGMTDKYKERMKDLFVENLKAYLDRGHPARNLVDYGQRY